MLVRVYLALLCLAVVLVAEAPPAQSAMLRSLEAQAEASRKVAASAQAQYRAAAGFAADAKLETGGFFLLPPLGTVTPAPVAARTEDCQPMPPAEVSPLIEQAGAREGLQPDLLRAVVKRESAFRSCAVSPKGALGLMQLMPATAERFNLADPFEPRGNIDAGARFLKELLGRYGGELKLALAAYNAGPGKVDEAGGVPEIRETQDYVREILAALQ